MISAFGVQHEVSKGLRAQMGQIERMTGRTSGPRLIATPKKVPNRNYKKGVRAQEKRVRAAEAAQAGPLPVRDFQPRPNPREFAAGRKSKPAPDWVIQNYGVRKSLKPRQVEALKVTAMGGGKNASYAEERLLATMGPPKDRKMHRTMGNAIARTRKPVPPKQRRLNDLKAKQGRLF